MDSKTFKRRREVLRYSQSQLAALLHVHVMTISRWERGLHPIPESVALLLEHLQPKKKGKTKRK